MKKILLGFGLLSVFCLAGCSNMTPDETSNCLNVEDGSEFSERNIHMCITGVEAVDTEMLVLIDYLSEEVDEAGKELVEEGSAAKAGLFISQENFTSLEDVKSTILTVSLNTGGAHPNTFFHTWTYREETGEILNFRSLFQEEHNPLWTIYPAVKESLMTQLGEFANEEMIDSGTGELDFENYRNFVLDEEKLVLFFDPYQVAAYAAGPQKVEIPFEDLQVIFKVPFLEL